MAKQVTKFIQHTFAGGWATDYGYTAFVPVRGNRVEVPWLNDAENCLYELDGAPRKMEGMDKNYAAALESGADISGVFDCWFTGTAGSPAQHRIMHIGTKIKKDDADDSFTDLFTGLTAGSLPDYTMMEDLLIMSNEDEVPKSWDGTTAQNLAGSPPQFSFSCVHKQKLWAAGVNAAASTLYYTANNDPTDWSGAGSGTLLVNPDDGDRITGIISWRDSLWVFKGPYKGSIHRITGSAPTGSDAFAIVPFATGIGSINHHSIVQYANDVAFMWQNGAIHSLSATDKFGDFEQASMTVPIRQYLHDNLNRTALGQTRAVNWQEHNILLFFVPTGSSTTPNMTLMYDYRFEPGRWAKWSKFTDIKSAAEAYDASTGFMRIIAGCGDGFLRTFGEDDRVVDGSESIPYVVRTPYLQYEIPELFKTIEGGSVVLNPKTSIGGTFGWSRDNNSSQSITFTAESPGVKLGTFLLGTDKLGNVRYSDVFFRTETGGSFRAIQYEVSNNVANEDIELHAIGAAIIPSGESFEVV